MDRKASALQQGMIDGPENNPPSYFSTRHYEVARHYSLDEHTRIPDIIIVSKRIWDGLSPQMRAWVDRAAAESVVFQRKLWLEQSEEALREVEKAGATVYRPDKAAFEAAMAPMYDGLGASAIAGMVKRIRETR